MERGVSVQELGEGSEETQKGKNMSYLDDDTPVSSQRWLEVKHICLLRNRFGFLFPITLHTSLSSPQGTGLTATASSSTPGLQGKSLCIFHTVSRTADAVVQVLFPDRPAVAQAEQRSCLGTHDPLSETVHVPLHLPGPPASSPSSALGGRGDSSSSISLLTPSVIFSVVNGFITSQNSKTFSEHKQS